MQLTGLTAELFTFWVLNNSIANRLLKILSMYT